jgi:hypothetical protein
MPSWIRVSLFFTDKDLIDPFFASYEFWKEAKEDRNKLIEVLVDQSEE